MQFNATSADSHRLSHVKSKETRPEILLRKKLWQLGLRGYRKYPPLPGKPDLLFPRPKIVIFIDGCFWHGCTNHFKLPKNNAQWWADKIQTTKRRDIRVQRELEIMGYRVLRLWEHDVKGDIDTAVEKIKTAFT